MSVGIPPYPIYHFIISFFGIDFQFLFLTNFNLQANILTTKDILSNLVLGGGGIGKCFPPC